MGYEPVPSLLGRCKQKQRGLRGLLCRWPSILLNGRCTSLLRAPRLRNDLYCVEWDVKLILYHTIISYIREDFLRNVFKTFPFCHLRYITLSVFLSERLYIYAIHVMSTSCARGDTICLRPMQVDNIFAFIRQVAPVPGCWLFKTSATSCHLTAGP